MEPRLELLTFGFALQGVICAAVAVTVLVFARGRMLKLVRVLSGAWAALAVYYLVFAVGVPVPLEADVERFVGGLVTSVLYFTFLILLGAGSRLLSSGRPIPARVITTLLAGATGYALVTMVAFLLVPDGTPLRYFLRVGLRSFLGAGAVFWGAWMLWRHREPRSKLGPRLLGTGLAIWGVTQAYYAVTSLFGSLGVRLDEPAFRMFLPLVGSAGLVLGGMAVLGWMLETERHQTEIQVTRGRLLFERAAAPMAFVSPDMRFLEANEAFATLLGYRPGELAGRSVLDFTHPEDVEASRGAGQTRPEDGRSEPFVKRYIRATGEVVWVRLVSTRIRDEEGRPDYYLAVYEDQTEVRQAEEALQRTQRRSRVLIEQSSDVVSVVTQGGMVQFVSPAIERLMGYTPEQRVGHEVTEHIHVEDRARVLEALERVAAGPQGGSELIHYQARHADGSWRHLESAVTNLSEDATVQGLVLNTRDTTDRARLEEQFRHAQKMESVGRLAGGIAHDFNNLLTVILGNATVVEGELPPDSPHRHDVTLIREAAERGADLTRQLLSFSRRQMVEPRVVDAAGFIASLAPLVTRLLGPTIQLSADLDVGAGSVLVDPGQLQQVLVNLVVNARDAMPEGGRFTIRTHWRAVAAEEARRAGLAGPGEFVVIEVEDTGPGIPAEARDYLFEPFFTTKGAQGTGLGLATCFGIARQAGGAIVVVDPPGGGAGFRVLLPRVAAEPAAADTPTPVRDDGGQETVLVVDDEPAIRALAVRALRRRGYCILEAADGMEAEAVSAAHEGTIDALITDVVMPKMGGLELATRLRRSRPGLAVLFISGFAEGFALRDQVLLADARLLEKPYPSDVLVRRLRELLDHQPAATPPHGQRPGPSL